MWSPVEVLEYDEAEKKYMIKLMGNGAIKLVGRLSLLFNQEDSEKFKVFWIRLDSNAFHIKGEAGSLQTPNERSRR